MNKDFDMILDKCIDRMNKGESVEDCLRSYPGQAAGLRPLLQVVREAHQSVSSMPGAAARSEERRRLRAAIAKRDKRHNDRQKRTRIAVPAFRWARAWAVVSVVLLLTLVGFGLHWGITPNATPASAQENFRLLVSDSENAIGDFKSLEVTVSGIGVVRGGESGRLETIEIEPNVVLDLTRLQGLNAQEVWQGILPTGQYRKLSINVESAVGTLSNGQTVNIMVPPGYMQIVKPFQVTADNQIVNFVFDITVVSVGNESDSKYILLPQIKQSGVNQVVHEVEEGNLTLQLAGGNITAGSNVTLLVTSEGNAVSDALVTVNGAVIGNTTADGRISFIVPFVGELDIRAMKGELHGKLQIDLGPEHEHQPGNLTLRVVSGNVTAGSNVTLLVTFQGDPVSGALVVVNSSEIGNTALDGRVSFIAPFVEELKVKAIKGDMEGKLDIDLEQGHGEGRLTLQEVGGNTIPGDSVTLLVTFEGNPVSGASVAVNDYEVGSTLADGRISFVVPLEDELEIRAIKGEQQGQLEIKREQEANISGHEDNGQEHEANGLEQETNVPEQETNGQ